VVVIRKRGNKSIIWPQYFDSNRSWRMGRKIPTDIAIPLPTIAELAEAATSLGYEVEIEPASKYPRSWWDPPGCLLINMSGQKKIKVMEKIVPKIKSMRAQRKTQEESQDSQKKKKKNKWNK
jgi:signal recognition particle subunit SEC65